MLEFCIGWFMGTAFTFLCILAGSIFKEDIYEEKKTGNKEKIAKKIKRT